MWFHMRRVLIQQHRDMQIGVVQAKWMATRHHAMDTLGGELLSDVLAATRTNEAEEIERIQTEFAAHWNTINQRTCSLHTKLTHRGRAVRLLGPLALTTA